MDRASLLCMHPLTAMTVATATPLKVAVAHLYVCVCRSATSQRIDDDGASLAVSIYVLADRRCATDAPQRVGEPFPAVEVGEASALRRNLQLPTKV